MKRYSPLLCKFIVFIVVALVGTGIANAQKETLNIFNWAEYMDPSILQAFEKKYNVRVSRSFYGSNSEMYAKLQAGGDSQYDIIIPKSNYLPRLVRAGLIQPLNRKLIPNYKNLLPKFRNPSYDPGGKYSAAYQWGDVGIAYNSKNFPNPPHSWSLIFDSRVNSKYPFAMISSPSVMLGAACAYQGHGYPCHGKQEWKNAAMLVSKNKHRPNFSGFAEGIPVLKQISRGTTVRWIE